MAEYYTGKIKNETLLFYIAAQYMIYYDIHTPKAMPGLLLADIIIKNDLVIPVFWLRLVLNQYTSTKNSRKIIELNKDCTIAITDGTITAEAEELYQVYKSSISFEASPTIEDYLIGDNAYNIYTTRCVEVRFNNQLIALGYFDEGYNSIAGILNFYHPDYKQRSLGKYLMLLKIDYALQQQKKYYYSGYISTVIAKFDYKLFPGKEATEVYISNTQQWLPWLSVSAAQLEDYLFTNTEGESG
jgi:arginine-tRNA-protein transferase